MSNNTPNDERRNARRFQVAWQVAVKGADPFGRDFHESGTLANLSSRGALFIISTGVQIGARLELQIKVPLKRENWMKYSGEVVRVENHSDGFGVAMIFETVKPLFNEP
jgi:hypothetical protein